MNRFGPQGKKIIEKTMHEYSEGTLKSGRSEQKVTNQKQAVAIGISKAREAGAKVPKEES